MPRRAPEFNEHGDEILLDLGLDWDAIIDLRARSVNDIYYDLFDFEIDANPHPV